MKIKALAGAGLLLAASAGGAMAQSKSTIKFAIWTPDREMTFLKVMKPFAEKAMADSKGALEIKLFPNGALGRNPAQQLKMMDDGVADITWVIPAYTPGVFKDDAVFELPNLIHNSTEGSKAAWRLYKRGMLGGYGKYYMIGIFTSAPYSFHMRPKTISMADLRGKKIRAVGPIMTASVKLLGAAPEPMPFNKIVEAISRGVIDGTTGHPIAIHDFGPGKVTRYHYMGRLGAVTLAIFMRQKTFDSLPAAAKAAIEKNRGEMLSDAFGKMSDVRNAELVKLWQKDKKRTVTIPDAAETKKWNATLAPVIDGFIKSHPNGDKLVSALKEELANIRAGK